MKTHAALAGTLPRLKAGKSISAGDLKERLNECSRILRDCATKLRAEGAERSSRSSAAIWLLDNYSFVQVQIRETRRDLTSRFVRKLGRGESGEPRIASIAARLVETAAGIVTAEVFSKSSEEFREEYSYLKMAELWAFGPFVRLALIERLCGAIQAPLPDEVTISGTITSLHAIEHLSWRDFVESVSAAEQALRGDPAGVYTRMDFASRDKYRHAVETIASSTKLSEPEIAGLACSLAAGAAARGEPDERAGHVGYYLLGTGMRQLRREARCRWTFEHALRSAVDRWPSLFYVGGIVLLTALFTGSFLGLTGVKGLWWLVLVLIPASQAALEIVNLIVSRALRPRTLPALDFSEGIPEDCRTMVVVPTLLLSKAGTKKLLEDLEIRYLANREANLSFGLLTDLPDMQDATDEPAKLEADGIVNICAEGIRRLNRRYGGDGVEPFYLFHRGQRWNAAEQVWMGYERKRGKLNDFNDLLLGRGNRFEKIAGDITRLSGIRYVITLDTDTQLPRDTARKLVGTIAHSLNRAVLDPQTNTVRTGYAVLQPRVAISMQSSEKSRLAHIFSGQTGFDPYATAVSDVYQDIYGRANFTGKGIYDVKTFAEAAGSRFPENTILSHDLIEGEHARTGLVTSVEVVDDYPATYQAYSKRKHRWTRGDWQIFPWLFRRVPGPDGKSARNPLPFVSRWKIFDNLRRSLYEISLALLFAVGWLVMPAMRNRWTLAVLALVLLPAYADMLLAFTFTTDQRLRPEFLRNLGAQLALRHQEAFVNLLFVPHQAFLMADAITRTLVRQFITKRNLLEWETMAQSETASDGTIGFADRYLFASSACACILLLVLESARHSFDAVLVFGVLWTACPLLVIWFNAPHRMPSALKELDRTFLRGVALRTWRYFADSGNAENHWIVPDNMQEDPPLIDQKLSPTNLGLQLTAVLAARDFGYIGLEELALRLERIFDTMGRLPREHGHFLNWYDTESLLPMKPIYVSTVDSGNLCASLCTLRQGLLELRKQPVAGPATFSGIRDHALRLRDEIPYEYRSSQLMRLFEGLIRPLEFEPSDLFSWAGLLADVGESARRVCMEVRDLSARIEHRGGQAKAAELRYWQTALRETLNTAEVELRAFAPWLTPEIAFELRAALREPGLAEMFAELSRIPSLGGYSEYHDKLQALLAERLDGSETVYPLLRIALRRILAALPGCGMYAHNLSSRLESLASRAGRYFEEMDFRFLFNNGRKLMSIGYDCEGQVNDRAFYDLLASEARTAVFVAIAKGDIPREAWFQLGRKITAFRNYRSLVSWSGTMFEYLMPALHLRSYENTVLDRSARAAVKIQKIYARERGIPWGISEAAHAALDSRLRYQYRAFGIPALSSRPYMPQDAVVAPYAAMLALQFEPAEATRNLRVMASLGWMGRYGFYDSADYSQQEKGNGPHVVRSYMAHHQGMGLAAISNVLLGMRMQERFHLDPIVQATEYLLQERIPAMIDIVPDEGEPQAAAAQDEAIAAA